MHRGPGIILVCFALAACEATPPRGPSVRISEVSCAGDDWIELHLHSDWPAPVDLGGWSLSDRQEPSSGHRTDIPAGTWLEPGGYRVFYQGRDLPFGLRCGEETVFLRDQAGREADRLELPLIYEEQSWGGLPDAPALPGALRPTAGGPNEETPSFALAPARAVELGEGKSPCELASQAAGALVCVNAPVADEELLAVTQPYGGGDQVWRIGKYVVPLEDDPDLLPAMLQNVGLFPLHETFLTQVFLQVFSALGQQSYQALVLAEETRRYALGSLFLLHGGGAGFSLVTAPGETPSPGHIQGVALALGDLLDRDDLVLVQLQDGSVDPGPDGPPVLVLEQEDDGMSVYTPGLTYGHVRVRSAADPEDETLPPPAWTDVLVLDRAPADLPRAVAGLVTAAPQTELSHASVRCARRGTPNIFLADAAAVFGPLNGDLVRLTVFDQGYLVETDVTLEEAQAHWDQVRPLVELVPPDEADLELAGLSGLPTDDPQAIARFGAKALNLATLNRNLNPEHPVGGVVIPMAWQRRFLQENRVSIEGTERSYLEVLQETFSPAGELPDHEDIKAAMISLRAHALAHGTIPDGLEEALAERLRSVFGERRMVRFRSSSNAEDLPDFPGAGLYDSASACPADQDQIPSACDPNRDRPAPIRDALLRVWTAPWKEAAWDEHLYHRIDPAEVGMAVLVTPRFAAEDLNGVAAVEPGAGGEILVRLNVQWGGVSVVAPPAGVRPERISAVLTEDHDPAWIRQSSSSLLEPGHTVLPEERLLPLLDTLDDLFRVFPREEPDLGLEVEFKIDAAGRLRLKQARPLPRAEAPVPQGLLLAALSEPELCSGFIDDRSIWRERELRARLELKAGQGLLPLDPTAYPLELPLAARLVLGPGQAVLVPQGPAIVDLEIQSTWQDAWRFVVTQELEGWEQPVIMTWDHYLYAPVGEVPAGEVVSLSSGRLRACLGGCDAPGDRIPFSSCAHGDLPVWERRYRPLDPAAPIEEIRIWIRFDEVPVESGPLRVLGAEVRRPDGPATQVQDFFDLAYATRRHNYDQKFLLTLDDGPTSFFLIEEGDYFSGEGPRLILYAEDLTLLEVWELDDVEVTKLAD